MESVLKENELIPLTFDIMFTEIFNNPNNICILEEFISNYLDIPLKDVTGNLKILSRRLNKEARYDSRKEVDLLLNYKGKKINIEMSNNKSDGVINRNIVYLCKIHGNQLKSGDKSYSKIHDTIQIMFNNFDIDDELRTTWYLRNDDGKILTSKLRIDIINLAKGKDLCYTGSEKVDYIINWCKLLTTNEKQNVKHISSQIMSHKSTDMLVNNMSMLSEEDEMVRLYTKLSRREMEYNTYIAEATEEGYNNGHEKGYNEGHEKGMEDGMKQGMEDGMKQGIEQGIEQGIKEGIKEGIKKGNEQAKIDMVKKMLEENVDIDIITKVSGLTKEEITELNK